MTGEESGIRMDAEALNAFLRRAFPETDPEHMASVLEAERGACC